MTVSQLVKTATGAEDVSVIEDDKAGNVTVLAMRKDAYGRRVMTRYDAVVVGGELVSLDISGAEQDEDDSEEYRSEYAMGGQW